MTKTKQKVLAIALACACALALVALAACSQSQPSRSSESFASEPTESESSSSEVTLSTEPFYVLVVGNDTRLGTSGITEDAYANGKARSDTIMLARVDPVSYQVTLLTVPRDTQDWVYDRVGKLNESYEEGGIDELMDHIEELTGVRPKYYLDSTFVQFQDLVNKLGGIDVYVPVDQKMTDIVSGEKMSFPAGQQVLDGAQALIFARERHKYGDEGEAKRQTNDRYIVQTMIKAILSDPETAVSVAKELAGGIKTNWPLDELAAYVKDFMEHADQVSFISGTGPYVGDNLEPGNPDTMWVTGRDEDTWAAIIETVDAGGDPNTILEAPSVL